MSQDPTSFSSTANPPGVAQQIRTYLDAIRSSHGRYKLLYIAVGLAAVISATTVVQLWLNAWNEPFFNAIKNKDVAAFGLQLAVFIVIAGFLIVLNVGQTWLDQAMKISLREWISRDLLNQWLAPKRAFLLAAAGPIGSNPDQRIQEDARRLTELTASLAIGIFQSTLLLLSFVGVLWLLSRGFVIHVVDRTFEIPGFMVWSALVYAASGSWLSWRLGRQLSELDAARYAREADFRYGLMRVSESSDGIALYGGEQDERRRLDRELDSVISLTRAIANAITRLTWVTAGYGWFAIVAPIVVAAPGYFGGQLTFGELMMVVGAFNQVQQALRWYVDNASNIADWRATLLRVMGLRHALLSMDQVEPTKTRIDILENAPALAFENVTVRAADRAITIDEPNFEVAAGEHVLVIGKPGAGKSMLFRALAGLWPWGTGRLQLPPRASTVFLPQRSYVPAGTLRDVLAYPAGASKFAEADFIRALERTNLKHLVPLLDRIARWDKELRVDEQQHLSFARLLVHRPQWIITDEALCHLNEDDRKLMFSLFEHELSKASVVSITSNDAQHSFYSRILHLRSRYSLQAAPRHDREGGR
jgi:vitamin B12/bleomycin/antimicrobial peptide transport system ATP-binding/permease protein